MKKQSLQGLRLSPASRAFVLVAALVIIILVLVWPAATGALLAILAALPSVIIPLAAFFAGRNTGGKNDSSK